jgi:hypothetical protein
MKFRYRLLGILLITAVIEATFATTASAEWNNGAQATANSPMAGEATTDCPVHASHAPPASPAYDSRNHHPSTPSNYQCCVTGHNAAVLQASSVPLPVSQCAHFVSPARPTALGVASLDSATSKLLTSDPPSTAPLRI